MQSFIARKRLRVFGTYGIHYCISNVNSIEIRISVKSMFQTELENMMGKSGLKMKLDAPQDVINDPTMEIKRMHAFVSVTRFTYLQYRWGLLSEYGRYL